MKKSIKKVVKKTTKKEPKKEIWSKELDKRIAEIKKTAIKNGGVALFITTTPRDGKVSEACTYFKGENVVNTIANFLLSVNNNVPGAASAGYMKFMMGSGTIKNAKNLK